MRIDKVYIEDYKNLKQFTIDLDEKKMKTFRKVGLVGKDCAVFSDK